MRDQIISILKLSKANSPRRESITLGMQAVVQYRVKQQLMVIITFSVLFCYNLFFSAKLVLLYATG